MYACIYVCVCVYVCICMCVYAYVCMYVCVCTYVSVHVCIHVWVCVYACVSLCVHVCVYVCTMCVCIMENLRPVLIIKLSSGWFCSGQLSYNILKHRHVCMDYVYKLYHSENNYDYLIISYHTNVRQNQGPVLTTNYKIS